MDDVAIIGVLRDAAEALSLLGSAAASDTARRCLADLAGECVDAATALAARHMTRAEGVRTGGRGPSRIWDG